MVQLKSSKFILVYLTQLYIAWRGFAANMITVIIYRIEGEHPLCCNNSLFCLTIPIINDAVDSNIRQFEPK